MNLYHASTALSGAIMLGHLVIAAFFWRYWIKTRERLFVFFTIAFLLLALERLALMAGSGIEAPDRPLIYVTRLIAFLVIIIAIWDANRRPGGD